MPGLQEVLGQEHEACYIWKTLMIKKFHDYTKNKDDFMGRENRRYWLINTKTGEKKRITEKQYNDSPHKTS